MAPAHTTVFLSQIPSTKNGIDRPALLFLAWLLTQNGYERDMGAFTPNGDFKDLTRNYRPEIASL